jgi:hypothetical protein
MKEKVLLREYNALCADGACQTGLLNESERKDVQDGAIYISGIFQRADAKNQNGRIYPGKVLQREINNYNKLIKEQRAVGTLDHEEAEIVNLREASHLVKRLWWDGDDLMGTAKVLQSVPNGQTLAGLINDGVQLGISSRALGSLNESNDGTSFVNDDLQLIAFDVVSDPSVQGAFMHVNESKIRSIERQVYTRADRLNRMLNRIVNG